MAAYMNIDNNKSYWDQGDNMFQNNYYNSDTEYTNLKSQELDFQSFGDVNVDPNAYYDPNVNAYSSKSFMNPSSEPGFPTILTPDNNINTTVQDDFDEPPLLEELEIYPDRILEKTLAVLNPFHGKGLADDADFLTQDTDLAGPVAFCLMLAVCLFVSGSSTPFGYIYGLSMISCIMMYFLLSLMTITSGIFTLTNVASILGYCLIPTVGLSVLKIFIPLHQYVGLSLALFTIMWSSISASRLFVTISGDEQQRPLVAYPCALVYGVFALLVIF